MDDQKTQSHPSIGDRAQGPGLKSRSPTNPNHRRRKRGGRNRKRSGRKRAMTKSERLSKKYFRICSWNCASAGKRIEVIEKLACDFDILCLQETRTRPEKPLNVPNHTVIESYANRGMAIIFHRNLNCRVSTIDLNKWCTSSIELLGIRIEK